MIFFLLKLSLKNYFKPLYTDKGTDKAILEGAKDIDTTSYESVKESTIKKVKEINQQYQEQLDTLP
ncbi:MAG: hypothetical protein M0R66_08705 [Candidatus Omnitrophica bacterium]|nr:hypothetical protein [Candidatus Omnitrophota bacterium]